MIFKYFTLATIFFLSLTSTLSAKENSPHIEIPPLDLTTFEYQKMWKEYEKNALANKNTDETNPLETSLESSTSEAIKGGEKLLQWIKLVNSNRNPENQIYISSEETRRGIPIYTPNKYGPSITEIELQKIKNQLPISLKEIIFGNSPIKPQLPVEDNIFILHAKEIAKLYDSAVRWATSMKPYLWWYKENANNDVRGLFYLNNTPDLDQYLKALNTRPPHEQQAYLNHLIGICRNSTRSISLCKEEVRRAYNNSALVTFKNKYWKKAQELWNSYFKIENKRTDVVWDQTNPHAMTVPFIRPTGPLLIQFLQENIEDEFQHAENSWELKINFLEQSPGAPYLTFKAGVTPHVEAGNIIVMDKNENINEYMVRWVIRHEFGHILRLPDCYVEFYDEAEGVAVNYQLDITDLMCSRAGNMNKRIYDELKRVYFRP